MKTSLLVVFLLGSGLPACDYHSARDNFDRQLEVCSAGERNGLLDAAARACGAALAIAEKENHAPEQISDLQYRLGRLERQRGRFREAEVLTRRSLALEEQSGETGAVASRLVELSLCLAGQGRWTDGAQLLASNALLQSDLSSQDREAAANAYRAFGIRLGKMGHVVQAEQFKKRAQELGTGQTAAVR
jgi:hypothetical protein